MNNNIRRIVAAIVASIGLAALAQAAAPPAEIVIPGERLITESLTSSRNGTVFVGSVLGGTIFRAAPGSAKAEAWIKPGTNGLAGVFGVFADDKSNTLWACSGSFGAPAAGAPPPPPSALHAFDLKSGTPKGKWDVPTAGGFCNDIAVDARGNAYITDTNNMEVAQLRKGGASLEVWAGNGGFGEKGGVLDGIAVLGDKVVVNALRTGKLFVAPIAKDGKSGKVTEVKLDRPLEGPDGQRSFGKRSLLVAEGGGGGKLSRVDLSGADLATGKVITLKTGFPDGPVAVTVVGKTGYVLEGQLGLMMGPPGAAPAAPKPFKATAVPVGRP
jgi:sugar lactone lactonase YvrE